MDEWNRIHKDKFGNSNTTVSGIILNGDGKNNTGIFKARVLILCVTDGHVLDRVSNESVRDWFYSIILTTLNRIMNEFQ